MTLLRVIVLTAAGFALAGCGADGEPIQPTLNANVGVSGSGTYVGGGVGFFKGPVGLYLGF